MHKFTHAHRRKTEQTTRICNCIIICCWPDGALLLHVALAQKSMQHADDKSLCPACVPPHWLAVFGFWAALR